MPGITGIIGAGNPEGKEVALRKMVKCMMHEPFYTSGTYVNEQMGLWIGWVNHKDSFSDCMPIWNENKDICLIFFGEDFTDYNEIWHLRARGHNCEPGNANYLVHFYEEMGGNFIEKVNGRFNGVIVDLREQSITLFNDRYGLNRMYHHESKEGFYFSSEAKSLLKVLPESCQLDFTGLAETFSCGCVLQNRTLFADIKLLPGGSAWKFFPGHGQRKDSYFRPEVWANQEQLSNLEYYKKMKETWIQVLPRYLRGKGQVAVSLTGGKDSRMIMAWAQSPPGSLPCYTFGGMYRDSQDVKLARLIAGICQQPHQVIKLGTAFLNEFPGLAEQTVYLTDGAMDVSGAAELYVNKIARQIAPIRLTGNYGQEVLDRAVAFKPKPFNEALLDNGFGRLVRSVSRTYENELAVNPLTFIAFKQVPWHHTARLALELSQVSLRSPFLDNEIVALSYKRPAEPTGAPRIQLKLIAEGNPGLSAIGTDRGVLYQSIPILTGASHLLKEFSFKAEYAFDYGMPPALADFDYLFKSFHLERIFLGRHKYYHFRIWYRDQLSGYIKEILLDPRTKGRSYLNGKQLEKTVMDHTKGIRNYTSEIHRILTTELIHRQFIN